MKSTQVIDGVFRLSANVDDIRFEGIWPIPNGIAMNSYIVKGEKCAIIDGVCDWDGVPETLFEQLDQMDVDVNDIDYVIVNHMEPDHSGWLKAFAKIRSDFTIVCTEKAAVLLDAFYGIDDERGFTIRTVKSGDTLDLGAGRVLHFQEIPNVHWPETMATYDEQSKTLFPCDAFGSFGSIDDAPYDDQITPEQMEWFEQEAVRYYANIVAAFSGAVQKAVEKLGPLDIRIIAPGHGIVWRKDPGKILNDYVRYASYSKGPAKPMVTVIWGSMYGNTRMGVEPVVRGLESAGVDVVVHQVPETDASYILASVFQSSGVVLAMPTYEYKMFPPMAAILDEIGKKKITGRVGFRFGSYGWSGGAQKELDEIVERTRMKWDFIEPLEFKGRPTEDDLKLIEKRGRELGQRVQEMVGAVVSA